ncbi:MAG: hypothetical protein SFW35_12760 [Chitinophagales bacterium]|nr:hypothetical protein [Chitinophagales bacterium]
MPNYNLGPTSIYQADAGVDTFYCAGDTTTKGPPVGVTPIPGVSYEWRPGPGIDSINASRQYVKPPTSQWYYLTITDTSIQGSCQSRTDSVYVEVRVCTGLDEPAPKHHDYRLLPNLFKDDRSARVTLGGGESGRADIYAMDGRLVGSYGLTAGTNNLELPQNMGTGVFVYQIWVADTIKTNGKLVIVK